MYSNILKNENYINSQWHATGNGKFLPVTDKYTQQEIAQVPFCTNEQMEEAIAASVTGFEELKSWSAGQRSEALEKMRVVLVEQQEEFAQLIAAEAGKPIGYARGEIARCIDTLKTAVSEALRFDGEMVPMDYNNGEGKVAFTRRFPIGPIAAISPFNFPLNLALHKIAPAIACGCSIVLKPAPQTPLVALAFAKLVDDLNCLPKGAFSVLVADIPEAEKLVRDERMKMLSFTGSPQIGWHLKNIIGKKKVALELGGNASVIVDESADLEQAAKLTAIGAYLYAGQICISTQRILVHHKVFDTFKPLLIAEVERLQVGDPRNEKVMVGPIIQPVHVQRIKEWVDEAIEGGAELLTGGKILSEENGLYAPTLLTNTKKGMKVCDLEAFGPVATLKKVDSFEQAVSISNDSTFGLQAGVFTNQFDHVKKAHEELEVGGVMINNIPGFRIDSMPYGGVKDSGLGREGIKYTMEEMTEPRLIVY
ncbi:MAG: aldehyde dehydrogenase [Crocinitomicaceae bacterium]|nr:aldehyde dehydrogenase [Crocinitomicaceae bacterium]|tara:strand:- start:7026 stop:8465 length:1440 start_codon:yes stop_codon:yes gene_type:complete